MEIGSIEKVQSKADLVAFIQAFSEDARKNQGGWENVDLPSFLSALSAWLADCDGYLANQGKPPVEGQDWRLWATALWAAKTYE